MKTIYMIDAEYRVLRSAVFGPDVEDPVAWIGINGGPVHAGVWVLFEDGPRPSVGWIYDPQTRTFSAPT